MDNLKRAVLYCLQAVTSPRNEERLVAESQLQQFAQNQDGFGLCLVQITLDAEIPIYIRQVFCN